MPVTAEIRIRDPFLVLHQGRYLMFASSGNRPDSGYQGVEVYVGTDLRQWDGPHPVLRLPDPGLEAVWAPEVHAYNGRWHLLVTLTFSDRLAAQPPPGAAAPSWPPLLRRGTWGFVADDPCGPFLPAGDGPLTPAGSMALDGTLHVEDGTPWLISCHEWVQVVDGRMLAQRLDADLRPTADAPLGLFRASQAPDPVRDPGRGKVTDGPFPFRLDDGSLWLLWSTFTAAGAYCLLAARSESGGIAGPWRRHHCLDAADGGHGMVFHDRDGQALVALHRPNGGGRERLCLFRLDTTGPVPRLAGDGLP